MKIILFLLMFNSHGEYHCVMESGDVGKLKFKGETQEQAFDRTARACFKLRVQQYIDKNLRIPSEERMILFSEDCVNKTYCKKQDKEGK